MHVLVRQYLDWDQQYLIRAVQGQAFLQVHRYLIKYRETPFLD